MEHDGKAIKRYWDADDVESMYDKHLLAAEIRLISQYLLPETKMLDAGCGEGEGTLAYAAIPGIMIHAADFSDTRLKKAADRLKGQPNVVLKKVDFMAHYELATDYDCVVSQRFLINIMEWDLQKKVLLDFLARLKPSGRLILLEGSQQGVEMLNTFRAEFGMPPLPVKWHNLFFDDDALVDFMRQNGCKLGALDGLGTYFLLTRGVRPFFDTKLNWDSEFNRIASGAGVRDILAIDNARFSRLKLWVFDK